MDKFDPYFTQTVVGTPMRMRLGVPTRAASDPFFASELPVTKPTTGVVMRRWLLVRHHKTLAWGAAGAALVAASIPLFHGPMFSQRVASESTTPAATERSVPAVELNLPFLPAVQPQGVSATIVPSTVPMVVSNGEFPVGWPASPAPGQIVAKVQASVKSIAEQENKGSIVVDATPKAPEKPGVPAQVVSMPAPVAAAAVSIKSTAGAVPTSSTAVASSALTRNVVGPSKEVIPGAAGAGASGGPRVDVVDIDKSSSFALITNPQTHLPQKVELGQKIYTGETVKKIDAASGRVHLDSRVITMQ
jgi:hypothetical protein